MDSTKPSTNVNDAVNTGITRDPMDPIEAFGKGPDTFHIREQPSGVDLRGHLPSQPAAGRN